MDCSMVIGLTAGRRVAMRPKFHGFDGPLAADALCSATRRRYRIACHAIWLTLLAIIAVIADRTPSS